MGFPLKLEAWKGRVTELEKTVAEIFVRNHRRHHQMFLSCAETENVFSVTGPFVQGHYPQRWSLSWKHSSIARPLPAAPQEFT